VRFTGSVEAKHGQFGRSSVAVTRLRVQRREAMLDASGGGGYASGLVFVLQWVEGRLRYR